MPQYVILADHAPDICPSSNARSRARAMEGLGQNLPKLSEAAGITFLTGPLHLDPGHRTVSVVEAPNIEAVASSSTTRACPSGTRWRCARRRPLPN